MSKPRLCPACGVNKMEYPMVSHNCYSRYARSYVCSHCGLREAMLGFFWEERAESLNITIKEKRHVSRPGIS